MDTATRRELQEAIQELLVLKCAACHAPTAVHTGSIATQRSHVRVRHPTMQLKDCFPMLTEHAPLDLVRKE